LNNCVTESLKTLTLDLIKRDLKECVFEA